jgi:mannitol PTS system EIIA component
MKMKITDADVTLNFQARNRDEALALADYELSKKRCVDNGFLEAMRKREQALSTWIGAGVAMPHIDRRDSALVRKSGFHVLQFPDDVKWEGEHIAFLVVAIAAQDNEHLDILSGLAALSDDELLVERLSAVKVASEFTNLIA